MRTGFGLAAMALAAIPMRAQPGFGDLLRQMWSAGKCSGSGAARYTVTPLDPPDLSVVLPLGLMTDAHVTPIDHQYYSPKDYSLGRDMYPVRAPADGHVVVIQHRNRFVGDNPDGRQTSEYRIVIEHTCTFYTYFDLLTSLDAALIEKLGEAPEGRTVNVRVPVTAGEVIGRIGGQTLDIGAVNTEVLLPGFAVPEHYQREPWKLHTVDPFDHYEEPLRAVLLEKNPRTAEPRGGRIDYDADGRFVGNWFLEGTNGYAGVDRQRPWAGHLAAAYHYLDPTEVTISIGDWEGRSRQFWVLGNKPDPAEVSVESGVVVYELVPVGLWLAGRGTPTLVRQRQDEKIEGVMLVEMIGRQQVRVETFPGKRVGDVTGFTEAARVYER